MHVQPRQIQSESPEILTGLSPMITPLVTVESAELHCFPLQKFNWNWNRLGRANRVRAGLVIIPMQQLFFCRHRWCANTLVGEETDRGQRALEGRKRFLTLPCNLSSVSRPLILELLRKKKIRAKIIQ